MAKQENTSERRNLFHDLNSEIGDWIKELPKRRAILKDQVKAFTQAHRAYNEALARAVEKARRSRSLRNQDKKPGDNWRWVLLQAGQIAALDPTNCHGPLVVVPKGISAMAFWAENLPFDPLGWVTNEYGAEPRCPDTIPPNPPTAEDFLMCKSALVAVIRDEITGRKGDDRLTPEGCSAWPVWIWAAIYIPNPTCVTSDDDIDKTARIKDAWKDVQAACIEQTSAVPSEEWSRVMTKTEIATALHLSSADKLTTLANNGPYRLRKAGNRQSWQILLHGIPVEYRKNLL